MTSTTININMTAEEKKIITEHAATLGLSAAELMCSVVLEYIEDALDLEVWDEAMAEHRGGDAETIPAAKISRKYL